MRKQFIKSFMTIALTLCLLTTTVYAENRSGREGLPGTFEVNSNCSTQGNDMDLDMTIDDAKEILSTIFGQSPEQYTYELANLDRLAKEYLLTKKIVIITTKNKFDGSSEKQLITSYPEKTVSASGVAVWIKDKTYWSTVRPKECIYDNDWISYGDWITEDNYNSAVEYEVTTTSESEVSVELSAEGDLDAFGLSGSVSASYKTSYSVGTTIPAWTKVGKFAYVRYNKKMYEGILWTDYYNLLNPSETKSTNEFVECTIYDLKESGKKSWSATNKSESNSATAPSCPSQISMF